MLTNSAIKILVGLAFLVILGVTLQVSLAESSAFNERTGHPIKRSMEDDASHDFRFKRQADDDASSEHHRHHKKKHHGSKSTTTGPDAGGDTTTKKPHKQHSSTTKEPGKKDSDTTTTKSPKDSGSTTKKSKHHSSDATSRSGLNPTTHLLLQQQEKTALDHMLAGVYDWLKVLKMTKGATLNKMAAGELLTQMEEIKKKLKKNEKPDKLVRLYKEFSEE